MIFGKRTTRQKEIRRSLAGRQLRWHQRLLTALPPTHIALLLGGALIAAIVINVGDDVLNLREGQRVTRAITSRVAFSIEDANRTQVERMRARDTAPEYYNLDVTLLQDIRGRLASALRIARENPHDPARLHEQAAAIGIELDDDATAEMLRIAGQTDTSAYDRMVDRALDMLRDENLIETREGAPRRTAPTAVLVDPERGTQREVPINRLRFATTAEDVSRTIDAAIAAFPAVLQGSLRQSLAKLLAGEDGASRALYRYDAEATKAAADHAEAQVRPEVTAYPVGSRLTEAGLLTREQCNLLAVEHQHYLAWRESDPVARRAQWRALIARGLVAILVVCGQGAYILARAPKRQTTRLVAATTVALLAVVLLARAMYLNVPHAYLIVGAQALGVAIVAITAIRAPVPGSSALLALLITLATRQDIGFFLVLVVVSSIIFRGLSDIRSRGRVTAVGALAALAAGAVTLLVGVVDGQTVTFTLWERAIWAGVATLAAAFLVEGLLPVIERLFGVTTNMTLLEWCDPNKPLLRTLAAESPGTYNHSLLVGALADAAADAIGANGLLARAGAYYHDIGKVNKPEYFVENQQMGMENRHQKLSPAMSHLVIVNHVKDGVEMAKAYGIPAVLQPFIPEHHGTTIVEYFYHAAKQAREPGDPEISDTQFRYPGPKPQSRETAIVMMCDSVEGAVRAMSEPTPGRIKDVVSQMIEKRLMDGQFDECDLTFRELATIRDSLVKSLISLYHGRISYPSDAEREADEKTSTGSDKDRKTTTGNKNGGAAAKAKEAAGDANEPTTEPRAEDDGDEARGT